MKYYGSGLLVAAYLSADKFEWFGGSDDYIDKFTGTGRAVSDEHFRVDFRRVPLGASYGVVVRGVGIIFFYEHAQSLSDELCIEFERYFFLQVHKALQTLLLHIFGY